MSKTSEKSTVKKDYTQVFSWGNDKHGQLGLGLSGEEYKKSHNDQHSLPRYCSYNTPIIAVS